MGTTIPPTPRPNHAEERNLLPLDLWNRNVSSEAAPPRTVLSSLELHVHGLVCSRPLPRTIAKGPQAGTMACFILTVPLCSRKFSPSPKADMIHPNDKNVVFFF